MTILNTSHITLKKYIYKIINSHIFNLIVSMDEQLDFKKTIMIIIFPQDITTTEQSLILVTDVSYKILWLKILNTRLQKFDSTKREDKNKSVKKYISFTDIKSQFASY